jgi:hypothetical protein
VNKLEASQVLFYVLSNYFYMAYYNRPDQSLGFNGLEL